MEANNGLIYIYTVRHGESMNNMLKKMLDPNEDVLNDQGKLQASSLGNHLSDVKFTKAISSPYPRCTETTEIVLSKSNYPEVTKLEILKDERIRERNLGFKGGSFREVMAFMSDAIFEKGIPAHEMETPDPEGDTVKSVNERIGSFWEDILKIVDVSEVGSNIMVCSHGWVLFMLNHYLKQNYTLINSTEILLKLAPNTGFTKLGISKAATETNKRKIQVFYENYSPHLKVLNSKDAVGTYAKESKFDGCIHQ